MKRLNDLIFGLMSQGKYFFSKKEALDVLNITSSQFRYQAYRLIKKGSIVKLTHDFCMIVPPEYTQFGSLPFHWVIDPLMKHLNQEYYIGLLSAASFYGATEQQPMVFQVITNKTTKNIQLGRSIIEFHLFKHCASSTTTTLTTPTSYARISTKEQTLLDLVRFYPSAGYLSNVALVIKSLSPECDSKTLANIVRQEKTTPILQRLGYILETINRPGLAKIIELELSQRKVRYTLLRPDFHTKIGARSECWKLILNDYLELE